LLASIFLKETISNAGYIGCVIIFAAILIVELVPELTRKRQKTVVGTA
jgi:drug/metabolite transporter (DMT)-like permease